MSNIKAYYCKECQKTTRHILQTYTDQMGSSLLERSLGFAADKTHIGDLLNFVANEYEWKCVNCGRLTTRKSDGTETFGYTPINPK